MITDSPPATVLFDGVCNLCNGFVQFVIARDPRGRFRFGPLQSDVGRRLLSEVGSTDQSLHTIVLVDGGRAYTRSTAALSITRQLRFPWPLAYGFIVVPRPLRDWVYDVVARNRYAWFGKRDQCMAPTPELRARFLNGYTDTR